MIKTGKLYVTNLVDNICMSETRNRKHFNDTGYIDYLEYNLKPAVRLERENILAVLEESLLKIYLQVPPRTDNYRKLDALLIELSEESGFTVSEATRRPEEISKILEAVSNMLLDDSKSLNLTGLPSLPPELPGLLFKAGIQPTTLFLSLDLSKGSNLEILIKFVQVFGGLTKVFLPKTELAKLNSYQQKTLYEQIKRPELIIQFEGLAPLTLQEIQLRNEFDLEKSLEEILGDNNLAIRSITQVIGSKTTIGNGLSIKGLNDELFTKEQATKLGQLLKKLADLQKLLEFEVLTIEGVTDLDTLIELVEQIPFLQKIIVQIDNYALPTDHSQRLQAIVDNRKNNIPFILKWGGWKSVRTFSPVASNQGELPKSE